MTIFATGTSGTIGSHFSNSVTPLIFRLEDLHQFTFQSLNATDDILIHSAGIVGASEIEMNPEYSRRINVDATLFLAKKAIELGFEKFVFISSAHVYKRSNEILSEQSMLSPINKYALQKLEAEEKLRELFSTNPQTKLCIVRVFGVLNWDERKDTLGSAITKLVKSKFISVINHGLDVRDFLTPWQIAQNVVKIAERKDIFGEINLCSGVGTRVIDAVQIMLESNNFVFKSEFVSRNQSLTPYIVGDNSRFKSFFPETDLFWSPSNYI